MCQQGKPLAKTFARTHFATVCHADFYKTQDLKGLLLWEGAQFWIFFVGATILSGVSGKGVQIKQKCFFFVEGLDFDSYSHCSGVSKTQLVPQMSFVEF